MEKLIKEKTNRMTGYDADGKLIVCEEERLLCSYGIITKDEMYKIMRHLAEKLAEYEDLEEQGSILIVPKISKNKTLYWIWGDEIMPVTYKRITSCVVADDGKPHIMCEMVTKKDRTFVKTYKGKLVEHTFKKGDKRYFYADDIGKTIFLMKSEAEEALKRMAKQMDIDEIELED